MSLKFERVRDQIIEMLRKHNWKPGDKFLSENQLALKLNCSRQTIRKAMNELVNEDYLIRVQGSGTYISDKILSDHQLRTQSVGILVTYLSDYIFPTIIRNLEDVFTAAGYSIQLASSGNSSKLEGELLQKMLENKVDGIVLEPTRSAFPNPNCETYKQLLNQGFPIVTIHSSYRNLDIPTVSLNDCKAGYIAAEHLINLGHRKIGAVLKSDDLQGHRRYEGVLQAHMKCGIPFDDKHVYWYTTEDIDTWDDLGSSIMERLQGCTALISYNDQIALTLEDILLNNNYSIPADMSIVSIDNSKYATLAPVALTSVVSPIEEIGRAAAEHLLHQMRGEAFKDQISFEPSLIIRDSTSSLINSGYLTD